MPPWARGGNPDPIFRDRVANSMRHLFGSIVLATTVLAGACAHGGAPSPFDAASAGSRSIQIEVRNFNWADATLYALRGAERIRIGVVTGKTDQTFELAWPMTRPLQIEINLLAGGRCVTRPLTVDPGDRVSLQIQVDLRSDPDCQPG